jgi:hypothetical protein
MASWCSVAVCSEIIWSSRPGLLGTGLGFGFYGSDGIFLDLRSDFALSFSMIVGFRFSMESCLLSDLKNFLRDSEGVTAQVRGISWKSSMFFMGEILDRFDVGPFDVGRVDSSCRCFRGDFSMNVSRSSGILLIPISESMVLLIRLVWFIGV